MNPPSDEIKKCILLLQELLKDSEQLAKLSHDERVALLTAAGQLSRPHKNDVRKLKNEIRRLERQKIVKHERGVRATTGIRSARETTVFAVPAQITCQHNTSRFRDVDLISARNCYICKKKFTRLHFFYDAMCPVCAEFNYQKRFQTASLNGQVALITGSRLKIGYQATLMMLRSGATVIATTRFPIDSALRYSGEKDFETWKDRLHIYGLDLRHTPSIEIFCSYIENTYDRLDILINNAAQTVRRPPGFYSHLIPTETRKFEDLPKDVQTLLVAYEECKQKISSAVKSNEATESSLPMTWNRRIPGIGIRASAQLSQIPYAYDQALSTEEVFPTGELDADLQQVDLRKINSWRLRLGEIETAEMLEIQLVNAIAPFVLCNRLSNLMKRDNTGCKHIVNVTAMEGKFYRFKKADRHPHTNMAKAALNMLTHTSASDLANYGIFMNAVDTGWVTDEDPSTLAAFKREQHDFQPPLDIVDGAARVCDPFLHGILTGHHWCGKFLKDYFPIDW